MGKQNILLKYQPVSKLETIICDLTSSFCYNFACHARVRPFRTFLFDPIEIQTPHLIALCLVQVLTPNKKLIFSITNTNLMLYFPVKSNSLYSRDTILQAFIKIREIILHVKYIISYYFSGRFLMELRLRFLKMSLFWFQVRFPLDKLYPLLSSYKQKV